MSLLDNNMCFIPKFSQMQNPDRYNFTKAVQNYDSTAHNDGMYCYSCIMFFGKDKVFAFRPCDDFILCYMGVSLAVRRTYMAGLIPLFLMNYSPYFYSNVDNILISISSHENHLQEC